MDAEPRAHAHDRGRRDARDTIREHHEVWIQEYTGNRALSTQYVALDALGRPKGRVAVPGGSRVREVGLDYVILLHQDPDGVESVRLHRLERR